MARVIQTADLTPFTPLSANEQQWIYNGLDVCVTHEVFDVIAPQLNNMTGATYAFSKALQAPVLEMTTRGLRVDMAQREKVLRSFKADMVRLEDQLSDIIRDGIGVNINWRSPAQLGSLLYDVMGLPEVRKRRADGRMSRTSDREALEKLEVYLIAMPIVSHILALRDLEKKRQFLETEIDTDGRMRTGISIAGTNTGRWASYMSSFGTGTNLQNVDRQLRSVFIPDPGMKFANLDLEQADARNVGAICWNAFVEDHGEAFAGAYLDACESGDLHTTVCRMAWTNLEWPDDQAGFRGVADQVAYRGLSYRDLAKKLGHGTNYFGLPPTMARHTKVDRALIEDFQRKYFGAFPAIGAYDKNDHTKVNWHNLVRKKIRDFGQLITLFGRRRTFFGRHNDDETIRAAIAYEPQSMTADEINTGILALWRAQRVQLLMQVHDSILFQYPEEQEEETIPWALKTLRAPLTLAKGREFCVPTEAKVGWNWGDMGPDNPHGLIKFKGTDKRTRPAEPGKLSVLDLL